MNEKTQATILLVIKGLLTLAFLAAGTAKLLGVEMMVQTFDQVGFGQWFRYVTGIIEAGSAILLWVPGNLPISRNRKRAGWSNDFARTIIGQMRWPCGVSPALLTPPALPA